MSPGLRFFGVSLCAAELVRCAWLFSTPLPQLLQRGEHAICWPFFADCRQWRVADGRLAWIAVLLGALLACAAAVGFVKKRWSWAQAALALSELVSLAIIAQDFRLRMNQHVMLGWMVLAFLLFKDLWLLRALMVGFYVSAGLLKLNQEWLTGAALYGQPWLVPSALIPAACVYVIVLELALVWGVFSQRLRGITLAQLVVFHLVSWPVVGFFYPLLMLCLLSVFLVQDRAGKRHYAPLAVFALSQAVHWLYPGDTALTGEGRLWSLHMFDARVVCTAEARIWQTGSLVRMYDLKTKLPTRIDCDPIVYWNRARALCDDFPPAAEWRVELSLMSRRSTDTALSTVIDLPDFCATAPQYALFRHNPWILPPKM